MRLWPKIEVDTEARVVDEIEGLKTAPFDARFPNQRQVRSCWQNYVDYHRCIKIKGEDWEPCQYFRNCYKALCPAKNVEKWNGQIEEGSFAGRI